MEGRVDSGELIVDSVEDMRFKSLRFKGLIV